MIYIVTLVVILLLVYQFDIVGKTQNKLLYYNMLMCWLTAISAFQYCVGSDTPIYMYEHDVYSWKDFTWDYIFSFPKRQPGWVLLSLMGKLFSDDYFVIKLFQAIIVNVAIFKFFRKQSKAIFTCIFFYFIMLYLDFSFNIMRASIAIAIFLLGYLYFIEKKWFKFYCFVFLAVMFHLTALMLLLLPLLKMIKINRFILIVGGIGVIVLFFGLRAFPLSEKLLLFLSLSGGESEAANTSISYLITEKYGQATAESFTGMMVNFIRSLTCFGVILFSFRYKLYKSEDDLKMVFIYLFIFIASKFIPILWRITNFFTPIYICVLADLIIRYPKVKFVNMRALCSIFLIVMFSIFPISGKLKVEPFYNERAIIQYYPYYSIFEKKLSHKRMMLWGYYDGKNNK